MLTDQAKKIEKSIKKIKRKIYSPAIRLKWRGQKKIFCVSFQRTGTTSVRKFLSELGYPVAPNTVSKRNTWSQKAYDGNFDSIFRDPEFICYQAFQDHPWFFPEIYKVLYHKFPKAQFILFERDPDDWFDSMIALAHKPQGNFSSPEIHAWTYRREEEFQHKTERGEHFESLSEMDIKTLEIQREHYKRVYIRRNKEVRNFFANKNSDRLFYSTLENPDKWNMLAHFLGTTNTAGDPHVNKKESLRKHNQ